MFSSLGAEFLILEKEKRKEKERKKREEKGRRKSSSKSRYKMANNLTTLHCCSGQQKLDQTVDINIGKFIKKTVLAKKDNELSLMLLVLRFTK